MSIDSRMPERKQDGNEESGAPAEAQALGTEGENGAKEVIKQEVCDPTGVEPHDFPREPDSKFYVAELTSCFNQPWAATTAFQQMWEQAKLCGLDSLGPTFVTVKMEVDGITTPEQVAELAARLEMLNLGELRVSRERERKHG